MPLSKITDHEAQAINRLLTQYRGKGNLEGLMGLIGKRTQGQEDAIFELLSARELATAVGAQLDGAGRLVGQPRNGLDDDSYRTRIQVRRLINRASGTGNDIVRAFQLLTRPAPSLQVVLEEQFPAGLVLRIEGGATPLPSDYAAILQLCKAAGVRAIFEWIPCAPSLAFAFDGADGEGFGDATDASVGGELAGAL